MGAEMINQMQEEETGNGFEIHFEVKCLLTD